MSNVHHLFLYVRLLWNHVVFWTFPTPEETHYSKIGTIYFEMGNDRKAVSFFLKSEESHHFREVSLSRYNSYYLGHSYLNLGNLRKATNYLETYSKLNRDDSHTTSLLGWCYSLTRQNETALQWYHRSLMLKPDSPDVQVECGRILSELGCKEDALQQLKQAEQAVNDPIEKKIIRSLSRKIDGDIVGAIEMLKEAASEDDADWVAGELFQKGDVFLFISKFQRESGDTEAALTSLELAFTRNPNDIWLFNELAMEYADQSFKLDKALDLINQALEHQPENPFFLSTKGWVLFKMGRKEESKAALERSLQELPDDEEIREHYHIVSSSLLDGELTRGLR